MDFDQLFQTFSLSWWKPEKEKRERYNWCRRYKKVKMLRRQKKRDIYYLQHLFCVYYYYYNTIIYYNRRKGPSVKGITQGYMYMISGYSRVNSRKKKYRPGGGTSCCTTRARVNNLLRNYTNTYGIWQHKYAVAINMQNRRNREKAIAICRMALAEKNNRCIMLTYTYVLIIIPHVC